MGEGGYGEKGKWEGIAGGGEIKEGNGIIIGIRGRADKVSCKYYTCI